MFSLKFFSFVLCLVVVCESAFVDTLNKCPKDDSECLRKLIQKAIFDIGENGAPELGIASIDPAVVKNVTITIQNVLELKFDGIVKGIKKAVLNKFSLNLDEGLASLDILCDVVIKGKYKVIVTSPALKTILGSSNSKVFGDGEGKMKIDKLNIIANMKISVEKQGDDIYVIGKKDTLTYTYDVGNMVFAADNLYLGEKESSATIVNLLNENWKILAGSFGKNFIDVAIDFIYDFLDKLLRKVSTKHYFIEDVSSYVKN